MSNKIFMVKFLLLCSVSSSGILASEPPSIASAQLCTEIINSRLERLACFDAVFNTAISEQPVTSVVVLNVVSKPKFWHRVVAQEANRQDSDVFIGNYTEAGSSVEGGSSNQLILSQSALGTIPPRPILVISCLDNITRLQILLHKPIDEGVTPLNLVIDGKSLPSRWFSESNGYLIRAGRGLPGIEDISAMFLKKSLVIRSKEPGIDNLSFDLSNLVDDIKPLRKACHW